ncbi:MAG: Asp-tRNA(Asn)/Glu-tRNA(Gln) amidotransferase GatCAB subunit A [Phycisphaerae bacterium]|nr:Asp-tRNA(Asn)/Glu-tRNA(Gln) amidotransferase GatCAB subunit A [Phycisphaerae bacterium]
MKSARMIAEHVQSGGSAVAIVQETLAKIDADSSNAFRETFPTEALAAAEEVDRNIARGSPAGVLAGVPVAIKDNICTTEGRTSCGSKMLENYRSPFDATAVTRLREAGAIVVGKVNCDEFAMGSSTETCHFGAVKNPVDSSRVPGGSSGGSAAAVSAGLVPIALGSDTGGSIRQPAAFCGVTGLKPSYGQVSRWGLVAFASSLDQIGPFTRDCEDAALAFGVLRGGDPKDGTCDPAPPRPCELTSTNMKGLRVGIPTQSASDGNADSVTNMMTGLRKQLASANADVVDIDLSLLDQGISTYYVIATAEASSNLARFDGIRYGHRAQAPNASPDELMALSRSEGFGEEVRRRIMLGTYVLSAGYYDAYYNRALKIRRMIRDEYLKAFSSCDVLLSPTTPSPAFPLGGITDPVEMYLCDRYTVGANIAGIPGVSVPYGRDQDNLPLGVQLLAAPFADESLLSAGAALERLRDEANIDGAWNA